MALEDEKQKALDALWAKAQKKQAAGDWTQADIDKLRADIARIQGATSWEDLKGKMVEEIREAKKPPAPTPPPTPTPPAPTPTPPSVAGFFPPSATPTPPPAPTPPTPTPEPWPEIPPTQELPPFEIPEEWMPQMGVGEQMTPPQLIHYIENAMRAETQTFEEDGEIVVKRVYSDLDIREAIAQIWQEIDRSGFGPHIPYYGVAQQYYAQIAQTEGAFGGGQLSPTDYLDYQLAQQQLALQQQLANLPYQGMTAYQQAQMEQRIQEQLAELDFAQQQLKLQEQQMWLPYEQVPAGQEEQLALQREQMMLPYQQMTVAQQAAVDLERQRYGAELAAQPHSWLEYAAYTGEQPAIQPWMQPLMPQQYQQLGAGQAIPGYQGTAGMAGMPQLTTPSRQYQARMGPTAMGQYQGYQQARTGARPEETEFRLWSAAPPSGAGSRLGYTR